MEFGRNLKGSRASAHGMLGSITSIWVPTRIDTLMQLLMAGMMAIVTMCSEQKPPLILPSKDVAHTVMVNVPEITVSHSDNEQCPELPTTVAYGGQIEDILAVDIWRKVSLLDIPFLLLSSQHYLVGSQPSTKGIGRGHYCGMKLFKCRRSVRVSCISQNVALSSIDWWWTLWVYTFVYVEFISNGRWKGRSCSAVLKRRRLEGLPLLRRHGTN
jgi:hypothetical protein